MDWIDGSYLGSVSGVGLLARALKPVLPKAWRNRLEACPPKEKGNWIWLHAVSVGELMLAEGLVNRMKAKGLRIYVTTGTSAGLALLESKLDAWDGGQGRVSGGPFPLDDPWTLQSWMDQAPKAFIALETEIWPNLIRCLAQRNIPRIIVNGRLTDRSLGRGGPWLKRAASRLSLVAARDELSLQAFRALGAPQVVLGGNLKADLPPPRPLHPGWEGWIQMWAEHPVVVAGNTLEGEEILILNAFRSLLSDLPSLRLVLAPRQPRRFNGVAQLLSEQGWSFARASNFYEESTPWDAQILLLDTLGELASAYALGTVALVGGGWTGKGGHNPLEPLRQGCLTLVGPGFDNFQDIVHPLQEAGLCRVISASQLAETMRCLLDGAKLRPDGANIVSHPAWQSLTGALERTWTALEPILLDCG